MLRLAFDFIITWRETRTRPNAYSTTILNILKLQGYTATFKDGLVKGTDQSGRKFCIVHPLWSRTRVKKIIDNMSGIVEPISIFDISKLK